MRFLRTISTKRLIAVVMAAVVVAVTGATIALAAGVSVPGVKPLANALHDALSGPKVTGVTARVSFTNHLIDSSSMQGSNPLLSGADGRLWWSADNGLRLELQSESGDVQIVVNHQSFWVYDTASNTVYKGQLPPQNASQAKPSGQTQPPSLTQIENGLKQLTQNVDLSGAVPGVVGDQPAYTVRVSPKHDGGLVGAVEGAWDAVRGVPLQAAIYAKGDASPVIELRANHVTYRDVPASVFAVSPPADAKVVNVSVPAKNSQASDPAGASKPVTGLDAVAKAVNFKLSAPDTLAGMPRNEVRLLDIKGEPGALITYGQGLGGIAVIEQPAGPKKPAPPTTGGGHDGSGPGLTLPTFSVNGVTGQVLNTALGTMTHFERDGIAYTVIGSVSQPVAEAAAQGL